MSRDLDHVCERLESVAEELADLALACLQDAVDSGSKEPVDQERRITRARRSVEKALHLLRPEHREDLP